MDYIQQAIDKARQARGEKLEKPERGERGERVERAENGRRLSKKPVADQKSVPNISYTTTRKVQLSDEILRKNRIIAGFRHDKRAEVYRQLRTQVLQKLRANNWKTLAVTSPRESAGKTVTAVNLAIALSMEVNQTVLLVDLDLGNPSVHKVLGFDIDGGIIDHLNGDKEVAQLLVNPGMERLVLLPSQPDERYRSEMLSTPDMKSLLKDISTRYDSRIIVFDIPSLLVNDDALLFTPYVDASLLVVEDGVTTGEEVEQCLQMLEGTNVLGTILNKAEEE